jgi:hypothetical protein
MTVSVGTTLLSAIVLVVLALGVGEAGRAANVVAVCCGIARRTSRTGAGCGGATDGSVAHEAVPFVALSVAGLVASTVAVARRLDVAAGDERRAVALPATNLAVFGALWCVQFVILDRGSFRRSMQPRRPNSEGAIVTTGVLDPRLDLDVGASVPVAPHRPPPSLAPRVAGPSPTRRGPAGLLRPVAVATLYLWNLGVGLGEQLLRDGRAGGTKSWKAFLFGSLDAGNSITVDKAPLRCGSWRSRRASSA